MDIYTTPLLTARDAAAHLQMPESTLDVWLARGVRKGEQPLVHTVEPERRGWPRVPFVGLIEAYVLRGLRDDFKMDEIRRIAAIIRRQFDDPYARRVEANSDRWGEPVC